MEMGMGMVLQGGDDGDFPSTTTGDLNGCSNFVPPPPHTTFYTLHTCHSTHSSVFPTRPLAPFHTAAARHLFVDQDSKSHLIARQGQSLGLSHCKHFNGTSLVPQQRYLHTLSPSRSNLGAQTPPPPAAAFHPIEGRVHPSHPPPSTASSQSAPSFTSTSQGTRSTTSERGPRYLDQTTTIIGGA